MAFPNISVNQPSGTQYVSEIDNFERETRQWLAQCMNIISGYPEIETVAVKAWTTNTRPRINSHKNLLGYNTDTNELEVIRYNGSNNPTILGLAKQVVLSMYPVGSYYETSDTTFNPNTEWGGTWVEDTTGRVLVARGQKKDSHNQLIIGSQLFEAGDIGGEETHNLVRTELPIHYHPHIHPHTHAVSGNFIQEFVQESGSEETPLYYITTNNNSEGIGVIVNNEVNSELHTKEDYAYSMREVNGSEEGWFGENDGYTEHGMVDADTPKPVEQGETQRIVTENLLMHVGTAWQRDSNNNYTSSNEHNNLQPYKVVVRWHRTA